MDSGTIWVYFTFIILIFISIASLSHSILMKTIDLLDRVGIITKILLSLPFITSIYVFSEAIFESLLQHQHRIELVEIIYYVVYFVIIIIYITICLALLNRNILAYLKMLAINCKKCAILGAVCIFLAFAYGYQIYCMMFSFGHKQLY